MANTKYTYLITDFPNNKANSGKLYITILESPDFTCMVDSINVDENDADIWFRASLSPDEWATLSGIVATHDGEDYDEEKPVIDQSVYGKKGDGGWSPFSLTSDGRLRVDVETSTGDHGNESHTSEFITVSGVTFEVLDANEDVGTGADQVAQGNHLHDDRYYTEAEIDAFGFLTTVSGAAHNELTDLDYASSGHTGFAPTVHTHTESDITDLDKYTQTEVDNLVDTTSGTLQTQINDKPDTFLELDDTPSNYSGYGDKFVAVKSSEDGLEFVEGGDDDGDESYYVESNNQSQRTSSTWGQKVRLTFTPNSAGYYEITYSALISCSDTGVKIHTRAQVDDTTTKKEIVEELYNFKYADGAWHDRMGHWVSYLDATEHNIDLDYKTSESGKAAYIKEAVITARRIHNS